MDVLYITQEVEDRIKEFCSDELVAYVFNDFKKNAAIIRQNDTQKPSKIWVVSDYINNHSINIIPKMNVILSFIESGGIIQIDGISYFDTSNPLAIVRQRKLINDEQLEILNNPWFYYHYKKISPHFTL